VLQSCAWRPGQLLNVHPCDPLDGISRTRREAVAADSGRGHNNGEELACLTSPLSMPWKIAQKFLLARHRILGEHVRSSKKRRSFVPLRACLESANSVSISSM